MSRKESGNNPLSVIKILLYFCTILYFLFIFNTTNWEVKCYSLPIANISTLAGGGSTIGDGLIGTSALLRYPYGIATSLNGDVYFADSFNHCVRKVSSSGDVVSTIAGNGLKFPSGVVVSPLGEIYIADSNNHVIRKVSTNGQTLIIAGTASTRGYSGDGGLSIGALLNTPLGLTLNSSDLIIVDTNNHAIRKLSNNNITTIAGTGTSGYSGDNGQARNARLHSPRAAIVDSNGEILIADTRNHRIRKISLNGVITTIAGTGTLGYNGDGILARNAQLNFPSGIAINSNGEIIISDTFNNRIRKILTNGTIVTIAGNGVYGFGGDGGLAINAQFRLPFGVSITSKGDIYITDSYNHRIRKVSTSGFISSVAGTSTFGDGIIASGAFINPNGNPVLNGLNNLVFADTVGKVRQVDLKKNELTTISSVTPLVTSVGFLNSELYAMYTNSYLSKVKSSISIVAGTGSIGAYSGHGLAISERLHFPSFIFIQSSGEIYFSDSSNHMIRKLSNNGYMTTVAGTGISGYSGDGGSATSAQLNNPKGIVVSSSGEIFISDNGNNRIRKVSTIGIISTIAGTGIGGFSGDGGSATSAQLNSPNGIDLSSSGELLIADTRNNRIRKITTNGIITTIAGNGTIAFKSTFSGDGGLAVNAQLYVPFSVTVNSSSGDFFIADSGNHRIRKVSSTSGIISTIAGSGTSGFSGDSGLATNARLNFPFSLSITPLGEIFIADQYNHRIRRVSATGSISTIIGNGAIGFNGDGLTATSTSLKYPSGVATNANGEVFIVDSFNSRIRKLSGRVSTIAGGLGDGSSALDSYLNSQSFTITPSSGEIYIADSGNNRIRMIANNGDISTIVGASGVAGFGGDGNLALNAMLNNPGNVVVNSKGEIFIADTNNHRIRKVSTNGLITTIAGNGTAGYSGDGGNSTNAQLNNPSGIAVSSINGNLYIADTKNHRIRVINENGTISTLVGNGIAGLIDGNLVSAQLNNPTGLTISSDGELYISDDGNNRIRKISLTCPQTETLVNGLCVKVTPQPSIPQPSTSPQPVTSPQPSTSPQPVTSPQPKTSVPSPIVHASVSTPSPIKSDRASGASSIISTISLTCLCLLIQLF